MKTLTKMKKVCCLSRFVLLAMALGMTSIFTSCSCVDDENIQVYSLKDVEVTVNAELKDNHILISKFPVEDLIKSIIEDPDAAEAIIKAVGDVEYKIPYQAAFNDNKDNILLQMSPEPLVLEIAMEPQPIRKTEGEEETPKLTVKVTIKADEKGSLLMKVRN